ncbi:MAG TPA: hypothetical protein VFK26_01930 [Gemmatimonadaceae bacterium]|jgi:hypothetical protein|nr:hypothetical protein [Gemmatimonadaceae bacterium]
MRFGTVSILFVAVTTAIQAQTSAPIPPDSGAQQIERPYRNPQTAVVLGSIIPGAGYVYAGEYLHAYGAWLGTIGGIGGGMMIYELNDCTFALFNPDCDPGPEWQHHLVGILCIGAGIYTWISSARDSRHAAERANARHAANSRKIHPILKPAANNGWNAGLSIDW